MKARFPFPLAAGLLVAASVASLRAQLPTGGTVVAGQVAIAQAGGAMTLTQTTQAAITNWQSFNVGAGASLRLAQPNAAAAMLARVTGGDPSQLLGRLQADGKLFLINPKGIVVGQGAVIDTGAFVASTLDVSDDAFLRGGAMTFKGDSAAGVVNLGTITAREGNVLLLAHTVKNAGEISAPHGTAGLGAGTEVYLAAPDAPDFVIKANLPAAAADAKTGVENSGVIAAARAQLEAAGGSIYDLAVNQSGIVRATGSAKVNGRVLLTAAGGTVGVSGEVAARNADGAGGEILIGGDAHGANAAVANAARTVVTASAQLDASAATDTAAAGRAIVWADEATRFLGTLRATGAGGGFAEVSGKRFLDFKPAAAIQLGAGGTLLLDPDALVISAAADSGTGTSGTNPFTFTAASEPATLNVTTLQNQLATSNVILDTSASAGDITFDSAVTWSTNHSLTVRSGNSINLNADLTGGAASVLALYTGWRADAPSESGLPNINGQLFLDSAATVTVGTLTFGANALSAAPDGYTVGTPHGSGPAFFNGSLHVGTLEVDLSGGATGVLAGGAGNAIGAFRTIGTGSLDSAYVVNQTGDLDVTINSATAGGPYLQFITPGTLTLKSGSSVDFATSGTVLLASTGGAFINQAGASVFGSNARYLIYTSTPAATTRGGLTPTYVFNASYNPNDTSYDGDTISRIIYSGAQPTLTLTANAAARFYGDANPAFSVAGSGFVDGDTLATAVSGAASFATAATPASGAGTYTITPTAGTLASGLYALAFADGTLTVNKAPLTVTVSSAMTKTEGAANPDFAAFTSASGLKLSDTLATAMPDLGFATAATTGSPAGNYVVTPTGTSANYALTFVPGQLAITATVRPLLNYAAASFTRTYGDANPAFTFTRSALAPGVPDDVTGAPAISTAASAASGVGVYAIDIGVGTLTSENYQFSFTPGTLTIEKAPLTAAINNASRAPNTANPAFTATYAGLRNGDDGAALGLAFTTTATLASPSGRYPIAGGGAAANYDVTFVPGTLTIGGILHYAALDVTRLYGATNPAFDYTVSGLLPGDTLAGVVTGAPAFATVATQTAGVGTYAITISRGTLVSPSYGFTFSPGTLSVTPAPLTIAANNAARTYGAANPVFGASFTGLVNGDTAAVVSGLQLTTTAGATSVVGSYPIAAAGATAANYAISFVPGTLTVDPAPLSIRVADATRLYGDANPGFSGTVAGLVNGDTAAIAGIVYATEATPASMVNNFGYLIDAALTGGSGNYVLQSVTPGRLFVTPAPLVVKMDDQTRRYGDADPALTFTVSGLKNGDAAEASVRVDGTGTTASADAGIGSYAVLGVGSTVSPNYTVTTQRGSLTIVPRPVTIKVDDQTRAYGDANPAFTATFTGLAAFDTPAVFGSLALTTQATQASGVGNWGITFGTVANRNYTVTPVFGTLKIEPAPLSFGLLADASRVYGRATPSLALPEVYGLKNSDTVANLGLQFTGVPAPTADAGSYTYSVASNNPNYRFTAPTATFRVEPAPLTVAITPTGRLYGDANPASYAFTANGLAFGQTAASVITIQNPTGTATGIGVYPLTPLLNTRNYTIAAVTGGTFQINPRVLTLDLPYYARYYGDKNPVLFLGDVIVGGDGLASFDTIDSLVTGLRTNAPTDEQTNTGYYRIDPIFGANANYRYSWSPGYLAIMPRPVEVLVGNGVSFGNNNVPEFFNPATLDAEIITFDAAHPGGTGYRIEISNLPAFASLADLIKHVGIDLSDTNTPQTVGVVTPLGSVKFPARPVRTAPVAATDPLPDTLPFITIPLTVVNPVSLTKPSPFEELVNNVIFSGGKFIVDTTGTKKDERFADVIRYLLPQPSLGGNYVVTAIHNGKLTQKADPVVVQHTLDAEAIVKARRDAEEKFLRGTTNGLNIKSTFGMTPDEFPLIREAFVNMLFDMTRTNPTNDFLRILAGGAERVADINQISNDAIIFWLADIHTNPAKQALLAPAMASYGVKIAGLTPAQRTPLQQKLVNEMTPYLTTARGEFLADVQSAQQAWAEVQYGNTNLTTLTGAEVPYEKFIQSGVEKTVSKAFGGLESRSGALSETDAMHMLGLASGAVAGVGAGAIAAQTVAASMSSIFPKMTAGMITFAQRAGQAAADVSEAIMGFEASSGVFAIVSVAVTVGITKAIAVGEEEKQRQNFETLLASGNKPVDAFALSETEQGHAILTLGLLKMFGGG